MKKILLLLSCSFVILLAGCSLDEKQKNVLDTEAAIQYPADIYNFANYENIVIEALSCGSAIYIPEIAADFYHPSIDYGNRGGEYFRWDWNSGSSFVDVWGTAYYGISHACFLIEKTEALDQSEWTADEIETVRESLGLCYFAKAFCGLKLLNYYCQVYNASNINEYGIMIVDTHNPSGDITSYPGRSTLGESYEWVKENAAKAEEYLANVPGEVASTSITIDAVHAFQARLALEMQDYDTAISLSTALIASGKYPLLTTQTQMTNLWTNDSGDECIVQMYADYSVGSYPSTNDPGYYEYSNATGLYTPDWILESWIAKAYDASDLRYKTWFKPNTTVTTTLAGTSSVTLIDKFPGNPSLRNSSATETNHINKIKLFRIAEQYFIAAEAYARKGNNDALASNYLNNVLSARISSYKSQDLTGASLLSTIKLEKAKEFIGEGFRWLDLKRWGEGMQRGSAQDANIISTSGSNASAIELQIAADYYKWAGPIPSEELDANPQIRDQQNPGY